MGKQTSGGMTVDVGSLIQAQKDGIASLLAQRTALQTQMDAITQGLVALGHVDGGTRQRRRRGPKPGAKRGTRGPNDAYGLRGRVLQALNAGPETGMNAEAVQAAVVKNGFNQSDSLGTQIAQQFGKLRDAGLIKQLERGIYTINAAGQKALTEIKAEVKAAAKSAA